MTIRRVPSGEKPVADGVTATIEPPVDGEATGCDDESETVDVVVEPEVIVEPEPDARRTADDDHHPGVELRMLSNMISRYLAASIPQEARIATGGNIPIIAYLDRHSDEDIFQYDIEKRFLIAKSTASRVLRLMEKKGLIERRSVERDARLRKIVLTDKAKSITALLQRNADDMERVLTAGIGGADLDRFMSCVATMKRNLAATGLVSHCGGRSRDASRNRERSVQEQ